MKKRVYPRETKIAVLNELQAGRSVAELCRKYEINANLIYRWKCDYKKDPERAFSGKGNISTAEARIAQYERLVGQLYAENRLLKKALERLERLKAEQKLRG
ncbi:MAG: transposase [Candidatus Micrarchaeota archaeon]